MRIPTTPMLRLLTCAVVLLTTAAASAAFLSLDPRATYLRTESDAALDAAAFSLSSLGVSPGDPIRIERLGFYKIVGNVPDDGRSLLAVFSGSPTLLSSTDLNRVHDAIEAGIDFSSANTFFSSLSTDITHDFAVDDGNMFSSVELYVPAGATHIFFTANDTHFSDNSDPNGDFRVDISVIPEPSSMVLAVIGAALFMFRRAR